jgi:hypothetical protein
MKKNNKTRKKKNKIFLLRQISYICALKKINVQSDQKENKSEQALRIIGHVVVEFYASKCSMHGCR